MKQIAPLIRQAISSGLIMILLGRKYGSLMENTGKIVQTKTGASSHKYFD